MKCEESATSVGVLVPLQRLLVVDGVSLRNARNSYEKGIDLDLRWSEAEGSWSLHLRPGVGWLQVFFWVVLERQKDCTELVNRNHPFELKEPKAFVPLAR